MKIAELARRSGRSAHTIRYYERIGLMPPALRDAAGHRDYGADALVWITFIGHMKAAGMPIQDMLHYARLRQQGTQTGPQRAAILRRRRDLVIAQIAELQATLSVLDSKIASYDQERTDHAKRDEI
ncbi:MerR family transcriptional regulator [Paracoccus fistulariae]|uniref:MerR family transcriptional regulator n=1 Tax=Paracoccus fistulariae TaxID=658446 RepID=A0ABY7SIG3_9RHOB|nr:MerR family transcriptional regulator [Paracoccus fistulariae]MDB6181969.1 MerR family transcriptional regulator [Paracoccus fistulariae]WCR06795.1 MerR family transcriptional regulator [Paracoccus fistulariae]